MRILVIDDSLRNIISARETLKGHEVTTCDNTKSARDILAGEQEFDAVLTDLFMPVGSFKGSMNTHEHGRPNGDLPVGLVFAIKAANKGIRTVICTDADHHSDWICSLLDLVGDGYYNQQEKQTARLAYVEARNANVHGFFDEVRKEIVMCDYNQYRDKPIVKDWFSVMRHTTLFPEVGNCFISNIAPE